MSSDETSPKSTIIDAKQAIFDKIFKENQELRDRNYELDRTLSNFEELAKEREKQHRCFEYLEESILKADDLDCVINELQSKLASDFTIPLANISLIDRINKPVELEFREIIESADSNWKDCQTVAISFISESDYKRLFPQDRPLISINPDTALLSLLNPLENTINSIASSAFIPLISRGQAIGTLNLASSDPEKFIPGTATDAVESLGRKLATVIENNLLTAQLQRLLRTDPLTGLYNRRILDEVLPKEFSRAKRYDLPLSLIMIDLDDFKLVNDRYGHPAGDMVLAETGVLINNNLRQHDIGLRYGGDEFTIILPNTNHQQGLNVIEKLLKIASECKIQVDQNTWIPIKMSAGLTTYPDSTATTAEALKKAADEDLYKIKKEKKGALKQAPITNISSIKKL
ncbi:MAG: sensor domain-containing diguanylate cyclase [Deltaproteobacteria bacterium]|nr:sensor domain-containing diguanylate cyclase [Candidatus Tharpella aukensis]